MSFVVDIKQVRRYKEEVPNVQKPIYTCKEGIRLNYNFTNVRAFCMNNENVVESFT